MAQHITDPRVFGGLALISSDPNGVLITGREDLDSPIWTMEFGVRDGKIYVVQDTCPHLSAELVLAAADGLL